MLPRTSSVSRPRILAPSSCNLPPPAHAVGTCQLRCSTEDNSLRHLNRSRCQQRHPRIQSQFQQSRSLRSRPSVRGSFTHAPQVEVASDCTNHDRFLTASHTLLLPTHPLRAPSSSGIVTTSVHFHHNSSTFWENSYLCHPCSACRDPLAWVVAIQLIGTHLPNDRPLHIFGTFCQSGDNLRHHSGICTSQSVANTVVPWKVKICLAAHSSTAKTVIKFRFVHFDSTANLKTWNE